MRVRVELYLYAEVRRVAWRKVRHRAQMVSAYRSGGQMNESKRAQEANRGQYETPAVVASLESLGLITDAEGTSTLQTGSSTAIHEKK